MHPAHMQIQSTVSINCVLGFRSGIKMSQDTDDEAATETDLMGNMWTPLDRPPPPLAAGMQPLVTGELRGRGWSTKTPNNCMDSSES